MVNQWQKTWHQMRRSPYQALAAVNIMFLTFFAISLFTLISLGSARLIKYFESSPQVIAFFEKGKDLTDDQINQIKAKLEATGQLASFKYVSTHEAEAIYREKNKDDPLLLELVNYKILPPSIEVSAKTIDALSKLKDTITVQPGVVDVAFYEDIVKSLSSWIKNIRIVGLSLIGYLLLQSALIISTITGIKITSKKEEIEILRLIGASKGFIRSPFVLEAVTYGVLGAFLGWSLAYILLFYATPFLVNWLGEIALLPVPFLLMLLILAGEIMAGILIGIVSSLFAVRRFLRR